MEVSHLRPAFPADPHTGQASSATMDDVDDMDIDLGPIDDGEAIQLVSKPQFFNRSGDPNLTAQDLDQSHLTDTQNQNHASDGLQSPGADLDNPTPHKIHIRGVDDLTTEDIMAFVAEHFSFEAPTRIEWIDDTSANIVFDTPATASKALDQLSNIASSELSSVSAFQLRPAKTFIEHPESLLQIRVALFSDRKRPRAYEASRFYMMHPEHDPREQRRRDGSSRDGSYEYRRRKYGRDEQRRRKKGDSAQGFEPNMYDDDSSALASRQNGHTSRRGSYSMHSTISSSDERSSRGERRNRHMYRVDSYRPARNGRSGGLSRDRSASPGHTSRRRSRARTPPPPYQTRDPHPIPQQNQGKELFPAKPSLAADVKGTAKELFPHKTISTNMTKELFPNKSITINHRRSDAFDAADETADLFASRMSVPFKERANSSTRAAAAPASSFGRLKGTEFEPDSSIPENLEDGGISIRGAAEKQDQGFSIRGTADDNARNGSVKELFPGKALGNAGKELFAEKLQGRGGKRNRAEDMFY